MIFEKEIYQEVSDVAVFILIGAYAESKGYDKVFFKAKHKNIHGDTEYEYMHYIHLYKDGSLKLSIYYDYADLGAWVGVPYYELYDRCDIERFGTTDEEEMDLFDRVKELI